MGRQSTDPLGHLTHKWMVNDRQNRCPFAKGHCFTDRQTVSIPFIFLSDFKASSPWLWLTIFASPCCVSLQNFLSAYVILFDGSCLSQRAIGLYKRMIRAIRNQMRDYLQWYTTQVATDVIPSLLGPCSRSLQKRVALFYGSSCIRSLCCLKCPASFMQLL